MKRMTRVVTSALGFGVITAVAAGCAPANQTAVKPVSQMQTKIRSAADKPNTTPNHQTPTVNVQPLDFHHMNVDVSKRIYYTNKVVVVTFHDISPNVYSNYVITPQRFEADLNAFHQNFNVITNQQFVNFLNGRGSVPPNAILLTFDDGYRDMYTYALPALVQHEMQGTFFDIVGTADVPLRNEFLTWSQIKTMTHDGMCLESHTYRSHYEVLGQNGKLTPVFNTRLTVDGKTETPQQYYNRVYGDFTKARLELSKATDEPVDEFAWPYGFGNGMSTYIARKAGYDYLFTTANGDVTARSNPWFIHRIDTGKTGITPAEAVQAVITNANESVVTRILHHVGIGHHTGSSSHQGSGTHQGLPGSQLGHGTQGSVSKGSTGSKTASGSQGTSGSTPAQQHGTGTASTNGNTTNSTSGTNKTSGNTTGNSADGNSTTGQNNNTGTVAGNLA